jgi:hypothetical protein
VSDALVPRVSDELEQWLGGDQPKTLGNIVELSGSRSFALVFVLLMALQALALPTGGATHVLDMVTMLVALQLVVGLCALSGASTLGYLRRLLRTRSRRPSASDRRSRGSCICRRAAAIPPPPLPRIEPPARGRRALRFCAEGAESPRGGGSRRSAVPLATRRSDGVQTGCKMSRSEGNSEQLRPLYAVAHRLR